MIPSQLVPFANHLWQSTLFAVVAGLLTLFLRENRARVRYWVWLSASLKFLVPFSILVAAGGLLGRHTTVGATPLERLPIAQFSAVVQQAGEPSTRTAPQLAVATIQRSYTSAGSAACIVVWALGFATLLFRWTMRWRRMRALVWNASPVDLSIGLPVRSSPALIEPGVFGILRPVMLLPDGIMDCLTAQEMEAIVAHELCHIRYRDNLASAIHMVVEAVFWFHPLVWILGARLMDEREKGCDEEVLRTGGEPHIYAEGILKVCELYLASPLACLAGVTGGDLKRRIEAIMSYRTGIRLNLAKRVALTVAAAASVAVPMVVGIIHAPAIRAQSPQSASSAVASTAAKFKTVSIRPFSSRPASLFQSQVIMYVAHHPLGGRFETEITLDQLIQLAYNIKDFQIVGGPSWVNSDRYAFVAKADSNATFEQMLPMLRSLLADRFKLAFHHEKKELPIYELAVANSGLKIMAAKEGSCVAMDPNHPPPPFDADNPSSIFCQDNVRLLPEGRQRIRADRIAMPRLIDVISNDVRRIVIDKTGFTKTFNLQLEFAPREALFKDVRLASDPSMSTALQEQLGLQLQSASGLVEMLVIDHLEKPAEN